MKKMLVILGFVSGFLGQPGHAEQVVTSKALANCAALDAKRLDITPAIFKSSDHQISSIWFVPNQRGEVHFSDSVDGRATKKYVVSGDLLLVGAETADRICAIYINKGRLAVAGWVEKKYVKRFDLVHFGSFDDPSSQQDIKAANRALITLSNDLPRMEHWEGRWRNWVGKPNDVYRDSVKIWKKENILKLDVTDVSGAIGAGDDDEDSQDLSIEGAMAVVRQDDPDAAACDIVMIGFHNALLATSGSHCMGSGAGGTFPEFSGVYWRE